MALEAFFGPGAGDDALPVAPAELRSELSLLLPQLLETLFQLPHLSLTFGVVPFRKCVPQLDAPLAQFVDLTVDGV